MLCALADCSGRTHTQDEGCYQFAVDEAPLNPPALLRDECSLLTGTGKPGLAALVISGDAVRIRYFPQTNSFGTIDLIGQFQFNREKFIADGDNANVSLQVGTAQCLLDEVRLHMDGSTVSSSELTGTLRIEYITNRPDACVCQLWVQFRANRIGSTCPTISE